MGDDVVAISAKVSDDHLRTKRPDGSYEPEFYTFGEGGLWRGQTDRAIDGMKFLDIAHTIAPALAKQSYLPATDPKSTKLLIMVYWGLTTPPPPLRESQAFANVENAQLNLQIALSTGDPSTIIAAKNALSTAESGMGMETRIRNAQDRKNAGMIGYDGALSAAESRNNIPLRIFGDDLRDEVEDSRFFVVLMAYDFQILWKEKKHKLVWETRFSIPERHHDFTKDLAAMAYDASKYFGRSSQGLVRDRLPEGNVEIGEVKTVPDEPKK